MNICIVGAGAFGEKHLQAIQKIDGATVTCLVEPNLQKAKQLAEEYAINNITEELTEALGQADIDAVILCTPTQIHAAQAIRCMRSDKHVQIEIPLADNLQDALAVVETQRESGLVCMVGHTRRYNPSHQWIHNSVTRSEISIQQMSVQTYFYRRSNINAKGEARCWTDHLLWHHAAHTVDLFQYQTGESVVLANALQGPIHAELGIAMDMSVQLQTASGKICTLSLSFNNDGPLGTFFRYICDNGTFVARYDDLVDGNDVPIDVSNIDVSLDGIELQDRDFISSIESGKEPLASVGRVLACYRTLHELELSLAVAT